MFEFYPEHNKFGEGSDFGRALNLANFLSSRTVSGAKTVAYIPKTIKGHAVLVAMACEAIVMAPDAEIGETGIDLHPEEMNDPTVRSGYFQIAKRRQTIPPQVALGMLDREVEVLEVDTETSSKFVLRSELDELRAEAHDPSRKGDQAGGPVGAVTAAARPASWGSSITWRPIGPRWPRRWGCRSRRWKTTRCWAANGGRCGCRSKGRSTPTRPSACRR